MTALVSIEGISQSFGQARVLDTVSLAIQPGSYTVTDLTDGSAVPSSQTAGGLTIKVELPGGGVRTLRVARQ